MRLQQFGVILFEIRTLKKRHTEQRRILRFYIAAIVRHRGTVGAWRNRGYLRVLLMLLSTSLQSSGLQDFLKRFYQSYQQHVHYTSVALCAFGTSVILSFMLSPPCSPTLCVTFFQGSNLKSYHSKLLKFQKTCPSTPRVVIGARKRKLNYQVLLLISHQGHISKNMKKN